MSDQFGPPPPPGGGPPPTDDDEDYEPRDSSEDLTVPWSPALGARHPGAATPPIGEGGAAPQPGAPPTPTHQPAAPAAQPLPPAAQAGPPAVQPGPPASKPEKSKKGLLIGGCAGCLFILLSICCCSGYVGYLEEGVSYSEPGEEIHSVPIAQGEPFAASVTWDGTGYADIRVYVDVGEDAPSTTQLTGLMDCSDHGQIEPSLVTETNTQYGDVPAGWIELSRLWQYSRSGQTVQCQGRLMTDPATSMRLVFTKKQRPSDWLSGF